MSFGAKGVEIMSKTKKIKLVLITSQTKEKEKMINEKEDK